MSLTISQLNQLGQTKFIRGIGRVWLMAQLFKPDKIQLL